MSNRPAWLTALIDYRAALDAWRARLAVIIPGTAPTDETLKALSKASFAARNVMLDVRGDGRPYDMVAVHDLWDAFGEEHERAEVRPAVSSAIYNAFDSAIEALMEPSNVEFIKLTTPGSELEKAS